MPSQTRILTLGVEEEFQIIDPQTGALSSLAQPILDEASREAGQNIQAEIHLSQLEIATPVCQNLAQVRSELQRLRRVVIRAAARFGKEIVAAGAHPYARWQDQMMVPKERYLALEQRYQRFAREQSVFGTHVHVGIDDRETAIQVVNHARIWLSPLLALTANSPFWQGAETGYASYRAAAVYAKWPQSGPPPLFSALTDYEALVETLIRMKSIEDARNLYWDMRVSQTFPTVEIRVMDQCTTIDEVVMAAGLARALVHTCLEQVERGKAVPQVRQEILRFAHWQAARYGLDGELIDASAGCPVPAGELIERFLDFVRPALQTCGDWAEISQLVMQTRERGNGASRQHAIYSNTDSFQGVVAFLAEQTAAGTMEEDMSVI